jgi:two-component system, OmpR family, sensor histidine kinase ChvG
MQLIRSMALVTVSPPREPGDLALRWSGRVSLTPRILAVNIVALALLAGSFFYLDGYRSRLIEERIARAKRETQLVAAAVAVAPSAKRVLIVSEFGRLTDARLRLFNDKGQLISDSWPPNRRAFDLRDREYPLWQQVAARWLDIGVDFIVGATVPKAFGHFAASESLQPGETLLSLESDRTHVISAAARLPERIGGKVISDRNARDIREIVRAERARLGIAVGVATAFSVFLSLFLARTIVRPLRKLARSAVRFRLGRSRDVVIPRLPTRRDEIGMLARAMHDMSNALRQRIDATEAFAADVAHELKNPLASLGSAVDSLRMVKDPALQGELLDIIRDDVRRLDRLISDISHLSRIDAKLSRTRFERVDMGHLIQNLINLRHTRGGEAAIALEFAQPVGAPALIRGDAAQLARVIENILDNAQSFSPPGGQIEISLTNRGDEVWLTIDDHGPGIAEHLRDAVFERFHSDRPTGEAFGRHSGLGLAIARTVVVAHGGSINATGNPNHSHGARFVLRFAADREA